MVVLRGSKKDPELAVSWETFQIKIDYKKFFDPLLLLLGVINSLDIDYEDDQHSVAKANKYHSSSVVISFEFDDFKAASPNINFDFFIGPGSKKAKAPPPPDPNMLPIPPPTSTKWTYGLLVKRIVQHALLFVEIKVDR